MADTIADEKMRAMKAYLITTIPTIAQESFSSIEYKYYTLKIGNAPLTADWTINKLKTAYWNMSADSINDNEMEFYISKGIPAGLSLQDAALQYWSGQ